MGAFVEHHFKKGFILDESRLRKLKDTIENRISQYTPALQIVYKITRGDAYNYDTQSIEDIINEDNEDWRAISRLEISCTDDQDFEFKLWFSSMGVSMTINGKDRDSVFLLFTDVREYITNEVLVGLNLPKSLGANIIFFSMFMSLIYIFYGASLSEPPAALSKILASSDAVEKLNYIIEHNRKSQSITKPMLVALAFMGIALIGTSGALKFIINFFYPRNIFLFGRAKENNEKRKSLADKLIWVIGAGIAVSLVASYIFMYAQKQ